MKNSRFHQQQTHSSLLFRVGKLTHLCTKFAVQSHFQDRSDKMSDTQSTSSNPEYVLMDNLQNKLDHGAENEEGDIVVEEEGEPLFEGSTHGYLIYAQDPYSWLLGLSVIIIQYLLYGIIIADGWGDFGETPLPVTISWNSCYNYTGNLTVQEFNTIPFECDAEISPQYTLYLAMILAAIFLQYDYLASLKIIFFEKGCWRKFAAILVLIEALMATVIASMYAFEGWYDGSGYDAIMNTVGVLFIHDIDEKVFESAAVIKPNPTTFACFGKCIGSFLRRSMKSWCTIIFIAVVSVACAQGYLVDYGYD